MIFVVKKKPCGIYYRMIQQNFIDMEKMLSLFKEKQSVQDAPNAPDLRVTEGEVIFGIMI